LRPGDFNFSPKAETAWSALQRPGLARFAIQLY